jgi:hypothetical protein
LIADELENLFAGKGYKKLGKKFNNDDSSSSDEE